MTKLRYQFVLAAVIYAVVYAGPSSWGAAASNAAEEAAAHSEGEHAPRAPLDFKADLALYSLVVFVIFVVVLKKYAWVPLIDSLDRREDHLRNEHRAAEEARRKAEQLLADHSEKLDRVADEVREILANARTDADRVKQEIVNQARNEAETTRKRAVEDIEQARDQAVAELFQFMADTVADATEHVLGRALNDDDNQRLIDEALAQFSTPAR